MSTRVWFNPRTALGCEKSNAWIWWRIGVNNAAKACLGPGVRSETRPAEKRADSRGIAAIRVGFGGAAKDFV